jgi:hypothetical protein
MPRGYDRPLYIQPFDHRGSFQSGLFGFKPPLSPAQTAEIAGSMQIIYDGFRAALAGGGFAVGRTAFWQPLVDWKAGKATREQAAARIASRYREFVDLFEGK